MNWYDQKITLKFMRKAGACWDDKRLNRLFFRHKKSWDLVDFIDRCDALGLYFSSHAFWVAVECGYIGSSGGDVANRTKHIYKNAKPRMKNLRNYMSFRHQALAAIVLERRNG